MSEVLDEQVNADDVGPVKQWLPARWRWTIYRVYQFLIGLNMIFNFVDGGVKEKIAGVVALLVGEMAAFHVQERKR